MTQEHAAPVIRASGLTYTYHGSDRPAIRDVSFSVAAGECVLLCGMSGCGKTTVTRLLNGLIPGFFHGDLTGSCEVYGLTSGEAPIESYVPLVGSVFQNPKTQYFQTNTTAELAFPCENVGMPREEILTRIKTCSSRFGLQDLMNRSIFALSGGEKQRTAVGAATMLSPRLLVLDEPTSNLDSGAISDLHEMLLTLKQDGVTIVLAEHRLAWAADLADRYIHFVDGQIADTWSRAEFAQLPDDVLRAAGLRTNNLLPYRKTLQDKATRRPAEGNIRLSLQGLVIGYDKRHPVLDLPDLSFAAGEIVGLMGHNGIGKTTLIRTLCGLLRPLDGRAYLDGYALPDKQRRRQCCLVMQDVNYQLFSDSVREEILMDTEDESRCDAVMEALGLTALADRHPMSLSGGQKQRVAIACAMVSNRNVILLDEPTSGLDRYHMDQVGALLMQLRAQGKTVLLITHDEELAADWCDRICLLGQG